MTTTALPVALVGDTLPVPCVDGTERPCLPFDAASATNALPQVLDAVQGFLPWYSGVGHGVGYKAQASVLAYQSTRLSALAFAGRGPDSGDVAVICPNATEAIHHLASRLRLSSGDVVVTTVAEHHANLLPWSRAASCRYVECGAYRCSLTRPCLRRTGRCRPRRISWPGAVTRCTRRSAQVS